MKKRNISLIAVLLLFILAISINKKQTDNSVYQRNEGLIFGTVYHITYQYEKDLHIDIKDEFKRFDNSLSTFNKSSVISKINQNDTSVVLDKWFTYVFNSGLDVYKNTEGAFDMSVAPLVNAWGFIFKKSDSVTPHMIDSIMEFVGIEKVVIENGKIIKSDSRMMFDASAIAKGYACDVIGDMLASKGIENYMVEIGGEVRAEGKNPSGKCWRIAINKPIEDKSGATGEIEEIISLCGGGLATSGNYRNFYYKDGKRYAHTIDPRTGYPIEHTLLSATVKAPECMIADAYATAFMVLGPEKSMEIVENTPGIEAFFICTGNGDENIIIRSSGFDTVE